MSTQSKLDCEVFFCYKLFRGLHGGYRIMVITPGCGSGYPGSIPGSRPKIQTTQQEVGLFVFFI